MRRGILLVIVHKGFVDVRKITDDPEDLRDDSHQASWRGTGIPRGVQQVCQNSQDTALASLDGHPGRVVKNVALDVLPLALHPNSVTRINEKFVKVPPGCNEMSRG